MDQMKSDRRIGFARCKTGEGAYMPFPIDFSGGAIGSAVNRANFVEEALIVRAEKGTWNAEK